jgi:excisionase family DNA binding protein
MAKPQTKTKRSQAIRPPRPNSIDAAAAVLGVCPKTVRNEIGRGKLKASKVGRRVLIFPEQLAEYRAALPAATIKI